jgi:integrase
VCDDNDQGRSIRVPRPAALQRACYNAGLVAPKPTLHDLRHSHASMLIARGYTLTQIQQRLGHRKPDTTLKIYIHQWNYHAAQQSQIGHDLATLITASRARV